MKNFEEKEFLPSFARQRIRGASSDRKKFLQDEFIPKRIAKPETKGEVVFEIGSGNGETAVNYASLNPHISYIACEVFLDGVLQMAGKALDKNLQNISFFMEDARDLLSKMPDESIKAVFLFFPDPWPKKRHHKRRILNLQFLEIVHKKLAKDGNLMVATDHPSYKLHINEVASEQKLFSFKEKSFPEWWVKTKYQQKALSEGRESSFYTFSK